MVRTVYIVSAFDADKAAQGALCVAIKKSAELIKDNSLNVDTISNIKITNGLGSANADFLGSGICRYIAPCRYIIIINGIQYEFNDKGIGNAYTAAKDYKLMIATVIANTNTVGNTIQSGSSSSVTTVGSRADGSTTITSNYNTSSVHTIATLNARDEFAVNALRELLSRVEDPSVLSDNEMNYYCNTAYRWAANMMALSAETRSVSDYDDSNSGGSSSGNSSSGSGGSNEGSSFTPNHLVSSLNAETGLLLPGCNSGKKFLYYDGAANNNQGAWGFDAVNTGGSSNNSFTPNALITSLNTTTLSSAGYLFYTGYGWTFVESVSTGGGGNSNEGTTTWSDIKTSALTDLDGRYVSLTNNQTVAGEKTFNSVLTAQNGVKFSNGECYIDSSGNIIIPDDNHSWNVMTAANSKLLTVYGGSIGIGIADPKGKLHVGGSIYLNSALYQQKSGDDYLNVLNLESKTNLILGAGAYDDNTIKSYIRGNEITMQLAIANKDIRNIASFSGVDGNNIMELIGYGSKSAALKIGGAYIKYDSVNKCLFVDDGSGGPMNFAATGGVTALGVNRGAIGSLTNLTITNQATANVVSTNKLWVQPYNSGSSETVNTIDIGRWDDNEQHYLDLLNLSASTVKCSEDLDVVGTLTCDAISGTSVSANSIALSEKIKVGSSGTEIKQISIDSSNKIMSIKVDNVTYKVAMTE